MAAMDLKKMRVEHTQLMARVCDSGHGDSMR